MQQSNVQSAIFQPDVLFLSVIFFISICDISDPLFISGFLSALLLLWRWRKRTLKISWIDRLLIGILLYQIISIFFSTAPISVFFSLKTLTFSVIYYFLLRICLDSLQKIENYLFVACMIVGALCVVAIATFLIFRSACIHVGFSDVYDFRHLYRPLGYLSNVWGTMLIGFTCIVMLSLALCSRSVIKFAFLIFILLLLLWNMLITFSRGVYLSGIVLLLSYAAFLIFSDINRAQKTVILAALLLSLLLGGLIQKQEVARTLQVNRSLSQQRSISGRMESMTLSYKLLEQKPLIGSGAGTYSQVINDLKYEDDNHSFTNFAPNGYTQLLIEQGIIGFVLWGVLFVVSFSMAFKRWKYSSIAVITLLTFIAILIRESSFPVLLGNSGFQVLLLSILAVFQQVSSKKESPHGGIHHHLHYFPAFMLGISLLICGGIIYYQIDEQKNQKALSAIKNGDLEVAEKHICKTTRRTPYLINRGIIYKELYEKTRNPSYLDQAEYYLNEAISKNRHDGMIRYHLALILGGKKDHEQALQTLKELTSQFPNKSLYLLETFNLLRESGEADSSFQYLLRAVKLSPDLLDTPYLQHILTTDSSINVSLKRDLLHNLSTDQSNSDPVLLAKNGKIYLSLGFEKEAKQCLDKAISLLPNLIYPYYYLSRIATHQNDSYSAMIYLKQFVWLSTGTLSKDGIDYISNNREVEKIVMHKKELGDHSYAAKFQTWYHSITMANGK
ncbi:MAG: O-antigen ligase family protein [Odoribacteraceae bacterium]|jgi:tetratricopeptide (TPR) repeat protein/O-antigen ligase|nr:O-antigen ligase family protein [Odoribacteraceae bacterium]